MRWGCPGVRLKSWALRHKVRLVAVRLRGGLLHNRFQMPRMAFGDAGKEMIVRSFGVGIVESVVPAGMVVGKLVLRPHIGQVDYRNQTSSC